jgi:formate hydrogenlyase transcriptional activator
MNKRIETVSDDAMEALYHYRWPGNTRELQNFIERAVILTRGSVLEIRTGELERSTPTASTTARTLENVERDHILQVLQETRGVIGGPHGAALRLGMKRTTMVSKMERLGISRYSNASSVEKARPKEL